MKTKLIILTGLAWLGVLTTSPAMPTITNRPPNVTNAIGTTATICVGATGIEPLTYQWRHVWGPGTNYADLPGATNACLELHNIQPWINTNNYRVQVCDIEGCTNSTVSAKVWVVVLPVITNQPSHQTLEVGETYNNRVTVTNQIGDLSYQWFFNGNSLPGKTTSTLTLLNVQTPNAGYYFVVVTNLAGSITSTPAHLSVVVSVTFTRVTGAPWDTDLGNSTCGTTGDYDGDGYPDLFISRFRIGRSSLYHNNGDGTFRGVTNSTFPMVADGLGPCSDFDNDGRVDLFAMFWGTGPSSFKYNNGEGRFTPVPFETVFPWWQSAVDYDHDGLLDLYLTSGDGVVTNRLYRNLGGRSFQAVTRSEVGDILGVSTFGNSAWIDYDDDGAEDMVAADITRSRCLLFRSTGSGRFVQVTNRITTDSIRGVVVNWGDYDNDGRVDLAVGAFGGESAVYRNLGGTNFERASIGITIQGNYDGASWGDYNNDGFLDLFMTYGNSGGNSLFRNNGDGTFSAVTIGPVVTDRVTTGGPYAGLWFDYDNDGFLDLFVPNGNDQGTATVPNFLYHNNRNSNAWLKVKLVGTACNRDAAGTKVRMKATFGGATRWQRRDVTSGGDPYGGSGSMAHFGLRDATNVETLRVEWPSGHVTELHDVAANQILTIQEPPGLKAGRPDHGVIPLSITGHIGERYDVFASTNVAADKTNWVHWQTVTNTSRTITVTAPVDLTESNRFFKAVPTP